MPIESPYANAPQLPGSLQANEPVDVRGLVAGAFYELEIGPGRGGFAFERLAAAPDAALLGFEVRRKWASIVDGRLHKQGLAARARVFAEDARHALTRLAPDGAFSRIFVHFPDPWWKKRHHKRTVIDLAFVTQAARLLRSNGELFIQTDVAERLAEYRTTVLACLAFTEGEELAENPYGARSPRERRAIADGLPVYRMLFRRG